jgi:hypothetical protein
LEDLYGTSVVSEEGFLGAELSVINGVLGLLGERDFHELEGFVDYFVAAAAVAGEEARDVVEEVGVLFFALLEGEHEFVHFLGDQLHVVFTGEQVVGVDAEGFYI